MFRGFSVSNLAWPIADEIEAFGLLATLGFTGVELAPARVFGSLDDATSDKVEKYRNTISGFGLSVPALQGLLFGIPDVHLFRDADSRARMAARLEQVAILAAKLGARACVFGAPSLRDPGELPLDRALEIATKFFRNVGSRFADNGVVLCLEANPESYGCRFVTHTREADRLVDIVRSPGLGLQLDSGTIFVNNELAEDLAGFASRASHVHVSEPNLVPIGSSSVDHSPVGKALQVSSYTGWVSIEMRSTDGWRKSLASAADLLRASYGLS